MNSLAALFGSFVLAQADRGPYVPPPLPTTPILERWLLENPWPPAISLAAAAVIVFYVMRSRSQARQGAIIAGVLILAAGICVLTSFVVTTDREKLADRTRSLIAATATANISDLRPLMASDIGLNVLGVPFRESKEGILGLVDQYMGSQYRVQQHSTSNLTAHVDRAGMGKTLVRVRVEVDGMANRSWWRITWRSTAEGDWQAMHIEGLQIDMVRESMIRR